MVKTYHNKQEDASKRMQLRSAFCTFTNIISAGTNCSPFEAEVVTEKAKEIFLLGDYNEENTLQPGQMVWRAIQENEPPGKKLSECLFKRIVLTVHDLDEDQKVKNDYGHSAKRGQQILRMANQALDQGTLLTQEDFAQILDCDTRTIREDIKKFQKKHDILVPTRGNKKDIGPGITHREKVVELYIQGKDAVTIGRELKHSLKAVERYINTFCRVVYCYTQAQESLKTALIVGISVNAVNRYLELKERFWNRSEYQERIAEIEQMGSQWWYYTDSKKKPGQIQRRSK